MKFLITRTLLVFVALTVLIFSCRKICIDELGNTEIVVAEVKPVYSTVPEFREGIAHVIQLIRDYEIVAYLDTLPNGFPNKNGRRISLLQFATSILQKLDQNQVQSAVYDVFHFDGKTFSLISYLMKAQMANDITVRNLVYIISFIQLPPIKVEGFTPPVKEVKPAVVEDCCAKSNPKMKLLVTWAYKAPCGNYEESVTGYAANNKLNNMSGGKIYRIEAIITGDPCPGGVLTKTVTTPDNASYGEGHPSASSVNLLPVSSGTYTVTFTYKNCGKTVTQTFTLGVK
jgi:hypothetical protein